jgi:hypothetical protein
LFLSLQGEELSSLAVVDAVLGADGAPRPPTAVDAARLAFTQAPVGAGKTLGFDPREQIRVGGGSSVVDFGFGLSAQEGDKCRLVEVLEKHGCTENVAGGKKGWVRGVALGEHGLEKGEDLLVREVLQL